MSGAALGVSVGFMVVCSVLAVIGRRVVAASLKSQLIKELAYEAIAAAELCACCFELIIGKNYLLLPAMSMFINDKFDITQWQTITVWARMRSSYSC